MEKLDFGHIDVSVIVPLFHGQRYVTSIVSQIVENANNISDINVELILYNDDPSENVLYEYKEEPSNLVIKTVNNKTNLGIHGARVNGLKESSGDIVMFLDQDDIISSDYLKRQIEVLGDGEVVVCKCIHNNKPHYSDSYKFEEVVSSDFLMSRWNSIVSPGQVLLRRKIIPRIWTERILKLNGSDDYYLWLLLCGIGIEFKHNNAVLFEHTMRNDNTSLDTNKMMDSEEEMINILVDSTIFNENQKDKLRHLQTSLRRIHVKELEDYREAFYCYKSLIGDNNTGQSLMNKTVGIYGAGIIGKTVGAILTDNYEVRTVYIDRNADSFKEEDVIKPDSVPNDLDFIVVTPLPGRLSIVEELKRNSSCVIYSLGEFIDKYFR